MLHIKWKRKSWSSIILIWYPLNVLHYYLNTVFSVDFFDDVVLLTTDKWYRNIYCHNWKIWTCRICGFNKMWRHRIQRELPFLVVWFHVLELKCILIYLVPWPPRSHDLTPQDFFLWRYLKGNVYINIYMPNTLREHKNNIIKEINRITPDILEKVMENTVRRIRSCLNNNGEHLKDIIFK